MPRGTTQVACQIWVGHRVTTLGQIRLHFPIQGPVRDQRILMRLLRRRLLLWRRRVLRWRRWRRRRRRRLLLLLRLLQLR